MIPEKLCGGVSRRMQDQQRTISSLLGEACLSLCGGGGDSSSGTAGTSSALRRVSDDDIQLRSSQSSSTEEEGSSSSSSSSGCYPIIEKSNSGSSHSGSSHSGRSNLKRPAPAGACCLVQYSSAALLFSCQTPNANKAPATSNKTRSISMGSYHDLSFRDSTTPTVTPCAGHHNNISPQENHHQQQQPQPQHHQGNWISPSNNSNSPWGYFVDHEVVSNCSRCNNNDCDCIQEQKSFVPSCPNSPADGCNFQQQQQLQQRSAAPLPPRPVGWDASTTTPTRTPPPPSTTTAAPIIIKPCMMSTKRQRIRRSLSWSPEAPVENANSNAAKPIPVSMWPTTAGEDDDSSDDFVLRSPSSINKKAPTTGRRSGENCSHHHHHHHHHLRMIRLAQKAFQSLRVDDDDDDNNNNNNVRPFHWKPQMEMKEKRSLPF